MMRRVALITGASRGIGAATALVLAERGFRVVVNYHASTPQADEVVAAITAAGGEAAAVPLLPPRAAVDPFGPPTPPSSSPPKADNVMPFHSDRPPVVPERPRQERPRPTRANPFHAPGEVSPAIIKINLDDDEEPADPTALSS